jgi:hypothetical protein
VASVEAGSADGRAPASGEPKDALAEVEADIARARDRVAASMRAIGDALARRGDWRHWVRTYPTLTLTAAAALGFLWGRGPRAASTTPPRRR